MKLFFTIAALLSRSHATVLTVEPGQSIQAAIELAQPGDTVELKDGEYIEDLISVRDGEIDKRITLTGGREAVVKGTGKENRHVQIHHDYITVNGFTLDGQIGPGDKEEHFVDKGLYAHGNRQPRVIKKYGTEYRSAIDGLIISNMKIMNFGAECVRLRDHITDAEIFGCHIENCGVWDFVFGNMEAVNGESVYIGTSSNQWADGKNYSDGPDECRFIHVHHCELRSLANEIDVKEGAGQILIEHNSCSTQRDPNSGCADSRADDVIFRYNHLYQNDGAGVRIGGHTVNGHTYGQNCEVYGNTFAENAQGAIKVQTGEGTHKMCENTCKDGCEIGGSAADGYQDIEGKCDGLAEIFWVDANKAAPLAISTKSVSTAADGGEPDNSEDAKEPEFDATVSSQSKESTPSEKCYPVPIKDVDASSEDGKHTVHSAVDNRSLTRWSAKGDGEWLEIDFDVKTKINAVEISFFKGDERTQDFAVAVDGKDILTKQKSNGKTLAMQRFLLSKEIEASSVKITGGGNSENEWNSLTEVIVCGVDEPKPDSKKDGQTGDQGLCDKVEKLEIDKVAVSDDDGDNKAENLVDGDLKTRWSAEGVEEEEIKITLEKTSTVSEIGLAVFEGDEHKAFFDVMVETEAHGWEEVIIDGESLKGRGIESYDLGMKDVKQLKVVTYGMEVWDSGQAIDYTSLTEIEVYGC